MVLSTQKVREIAEKNCRIERRETKFYPLINCFDPVYYQFNWVKKILLSKFRNSRQKHPNYDFIYVFMKSEEEVLSYYPDLPVHFEKKIAVTTLVMNFFKKFFFQNASNRLNIRYKNWSWLRKALIRKFTNAGGYRHSGSVCAISMF